MPTNVTLFQSKVNFLQITQAANTYTDGLLAILTIITVYVLTFILFKKWDTKMAMFGSCTIGLIAGVFFFWMSLIDWNTLIFQTVIFLFSLFSVSWRPESV